MNPDALKNLKQKVENINLSIEKNNLKIKKLNFNNSELEKVRQLTQLRIEQIESGTIINHITDEQKLEQSKKDKQIYQEKLNSAGGMMSNFKF